MIFTGVSFPTWCLLIGGLNLILGLALLAGRGAAALRRFPRSPAAGIALSTLGFLWAAAIVHAAPLDFIAPYKVQVIVVLLVSIPLSWFLMGDLLAARALGFLLVLLPAPVLVATRFLDSGWRLVMVVLMYVYAIAGMFLVGMPFLGRDALFWTAAKPRRVAAVGAVLVLLGLVLLLLPRLA